MKNAKETAVITAEHRDEEGRKCVEKLELKTQNLNTVKYVERKLTEKGVNRKERHPSDGIPLKRPPSKSGHGGKFTWEGPGDVAEYEMDPDPPAVDEGDPNYVADGGGDGHDVAAELVVGEVEVAKEAPEGVARVEIDPNLLNR